MNPEESERYLKYLIELTKLVDITPNDTDLGQKIRIRIKQIEKQL